MFRFGPVIGWLFLSFSACFGWCWGSCSEGRIGWGSRSSFFHCDLSARCCEGSGGSFNCYGVFTVYRSLFFYWLSVLGANIAEEVVSHWSLRNPQCVIFSSSPPKFYPTTPFLVEGYWMEVLGGGSFCIVSDRFFWWYNVIRDRSPPYPSIHISFWGSNPPLVESIQLEVPTVLCPLCQGIRFEDLGLNVTLELSITRLGYCLMTCWLTIIP